MAEKEEAKTEIEYELDAEGKAIIKNLDTTGISVNDVSRFLVDQILNKRRLICKQHQLTSAYYLCLQQLFSKVPTFYLAKVLPYFSNWMHVNFTLNVASLAIF